MHASTTSGPPPPRPPARARAPHALSHAVSPSSALPLNDTLLSRFVTGQTTCAETRKGKGREGSARWHLRYTAE